MSIVNLEKIEHKIIGRMFRTVRIADKMIAAEVTKQGLTKPQFDILLILKYSQLDSVTTTQLADELLVSKANITGIVTRLEKARLLTKVTDENDTRSKKITLTPAGEELISQIIPRYFEMTVEAFSNFTQDEKNKLFEQLVFIEEFYNSQR